MIWVVGKIISYDENLISDDEGSQGIADTMGLLLNHHGLLFGFKHSEFSNRNKLTQLLHLRLHEQEEASLNSSTLT